MNLINYYNDNVDENDYYYSFIYSIDKFTSNLSNYREHRKFDIEVYDDYEAKKSL